MSFELEPKKKSDVQFNGETFNLKWSIPYASAVNNEFQERYNHLIKLYQELVEEIYWNELIYNLDMKFKPVVGQHYYLYKNYDDKYFLSIIAPTEWKMNFIAQFKFEHTGKWLKI